MSLNPKRTVAELKELRALTADENGAQRVAWTDTWLKAREWFASKLKGLPVEHHYDAAGNGWVTLHPSDAASRGIGANDPVRVFNDRGECNLQAAVATTVAEGVVCVRSTRWPKLAADGNSVNMLTSQRLTDKGGGPAFYSCLVEVEKI